MNNHEQKAHTRVTDVLAKRLDDLEVVVAALDDRVADAARATLASVREERTARQQLGENLTTALATESHIRLRLGDELRAADVGLHAYVDRGDKPHDAFRARGWRARWRWLLSGR